MSACSSCCLLMHHREEIRASGMSGPLTQKFAVSLAQLLPNFPCAWVEEGAYLIPQ